MQQPPPTDDEPTERQRRKLLASILRSAPNSLLIANAVILTVIVGALLWYRWAVTQDARWLFAAGVLSLLVLTLLLSLHRLGPRRLPPSTRRPPPPP